MSSEKSFIAPTNGGDNGQRPPERVILPPVQITGQNIARAHRSKRQRLRLVEFLVSGRAVLVRPTVKQACAMARILVAEVYRARRVSKPRPVPPSLAEQILAASDDVLAETTRKVGCDVIWDRLLMPVLGNGNAGAAK